MTERSQDIENATRRRLLRTGVAAVPMMVTIKAAHAQTGPMQDMLGSIACLRHSTIPEDYQAAVEEVADKLGLSENESLGPQSSVQDRPGGWIGSRMGESLRQGGISTQGTDGDADYQNWSYEDVEQYFYAGRGDFYLGAEYNPNSQYHNTFLEITMSTACWNSIQTQMARS